jgi:hypothetical protein
MQCETHVVAVSEMATVREPETHEAVVGLNESGQSSEAEGRSQSTGIRNSDIFRCTYFAVCKDC